MKKNMMSVIILALCLVNLVMNAMIMFTVIPTFKKTNNLIAQVVSVIDLELGSPSSSEDFIPSVAAENLEVVNFEQSLVCNLKPSANDSTSHFAMVDMVSISLNKKSKDYKKKGATISTYETQILEYVQDGFNAYTYEEVNENKELIKNDIILNLQEYFESDMIVGISFKNLRFQ